MIQIVPTRTKLLVFAASVVVSVSSFAVILTGFQQLAATSPCLVNSQTDAHTVATSATATPTRAKL
jgi:hypothetical protein